MNKLKGCEGDTIDENGLILTCGNKYKYGNGEKVFICDECLKKGVDELKYKLNGFMVMSHVYQLRSLFYGYNVSFDRWDLKRGETKTFSILTGLTMYKARKNLIKCLNIFDSYNKDVVMMFLGVKE